MTLIAQHTVGRLALAISGLALVITTATAADARPIRHGAATSVSRDMPRPPSSRPGPRPRPEGGHHGGGEGGHHGGGGGGYPDNVGNWSRPPGPSGGHRPPPPSNHGDGGHYYGGGGGYYDHDRYDDHRQHDRYWRDDDDDDFWDFMGTAALVTAGVALIGAATDDPPSGSCEERAVDSNTYLQCDDRWYARINDGGKTKYQQVQRPY